MLIGKLLDSGEAVCHHLQGLSSPRQLWTAQALHRETAVSFNKESSYVSVTLCFMPEDFDL
jgi:hypothetical protein